MSKSRVALRAGLIIHLQPLRGGRFIHQAVANTGIIFSDSLSSLADTEAREDAVEDIVGGGRAGDGVDGRERAVEIE